MTMISVPIFVVALFAVLAISAIAQVQVQAQSQVQQQQSVSKQSQLVQSTIKNPSIVIDSRTPTSNASSPLRVSNVTLALNPTDSHYHIIGSLTNNLHTTIDMPVVSVWLSDKNTATLLRILPDTINKPLDPGQSEQFNIDTKYTVNQVDQFKFMSVAIFAN